MPARMKAAIFVEPNRIVLDDKPVPPARSVPGNSMLSREKAVAFAASVGWCTRLPDPLRRSLLGAARVRSLAPGTRLYAIGDDPAQMYFLAHGCLAAEISPSILLPQKSSLLYSGIWLAEGVAAVSSRKVGIWATRQSVVLAIDNADFRRVALAHPDAWRYVALLNLQHDYRTMGLAHDLMIRGGRRRFAAILARMAGLCEEVVPSPLIIDATQAELADIANLARSVVSGFLKEFERDGVPGENQAKSICYLMAIFGPLGRAKAGCFCPRSSGI